MRETKESSCVSGFVLVIVVSLIEKKSVAADPDADKRGKDQFRCIDRLHEFVWTYIFPVSLENRSAVIVILTAWRMSGLIIFSADRI